MPFQHVCLSFLLLRSPPISRVAQSISEVVFEYKGKFPVGEDMIKIQISLSMWTVKFEKAEGVMLPRMAWRGIAAGT